jgi:hypothetical protein
LRVRPDFPEPAALATGANPAARDTFKRATESRAAWLACSASFCAAILGSIGESNPLAILDPDTDTLHLFPQDIIIAMNGLYRAIAGVEVDALRLPLKKKLSAISELPAHIATFRRHLARLIIAGQGQAPPSRDRCVQTVYSISLPFPRFSLVYSVAYCDKRGNCSANV